MLKSKDISLLYDFAVVCRQGNLTRAAEELNTVQSAVTQRMRRLEDALGTKLLKRHSRGVTPTEQGQILLKYATKLNFLVSDAVSEIEAWEGSPSGSVSIGLPPSVSAVLTTPLIEAVNSALPKVELTVAEAFSGYLSGWLDNGEIDFGFVFNKTSNESMVVQPLAEEELYLITDLKTACKLPPTVTLEDLAALQLIAPSRRHGLRTDIQNEAFRRGVELNIKLEVDAGHQLIRQVLRGAGSSVLARSAVMPELTEGLLEARQIVDPVFRRTICLAIKREKIDSYLLRQIGNAMLGVVEDLIESGAWPCKKLEWQEQMFP